MATTPTSDTIPTDLGALRIDGDRLIARLDELSKVGGTERGGVTRTAFSPSDVAARELVASWMRTAGLVTEVDAATNLIGSRAAGPHDGPMPTNLVMGSHLDTVVEGGHLDGAYGVVAAVEVATTLAEHGHRLGHGLRVVAFADEEGANGTPGMLGSQAIMGVLDPAELERHDDSDIRIADRVLAAGGAPAQIMSAAWDAETIAGYLELHIEQGPVLTDEGLQIGVVEAITGRRIVEVLLTGSSNHAGTTPMHLRQDAMSAAAEVILAVEQLALDGLVRVATCGHIKASPNVRNVVAGHVALGLDIRDVDNERIDAAVAVLRERVVPIAERRSVQIELIDGQGVTAMPCDDGLVGDVTRAAELLSLPSMRMPSGAGHDAQVVARGAPIAMVFVPRRNGLSHNPDEYTEPAALISGANVLLQALLAADERLDR
ncbi:Zn-dependent hydrolase [soil metagenome]